MKKTMFNSRVFITKKKKCYIHRGKCLKKFAPTWIRTRITGFKVPCANHYTIGAHQLGKLKESYLC